MLFGKRNLVIRILGQMISISLEENSPDLKLQDVKRYFTATDVGQERSVIV